MALQEELFPDPEVVVTPDDARREPLVWVSRLVIWEKPDEILREVILRRGLNIIWSPDPGADQAALGQDAGSGHGAGKTLFCRLLRYCLGEDSFSNDDQRRSIAQQLPGGLVGAEVIIAGKPWAVIRPIGMTRKHFAREGVSLEAISPMKDPAESIQPFLDALGAALFSEGIEKYLPVEHQNAPWLFALAWLSRDQECRFDHILDWRHRRADSGSIATNPTKDQLLIVVRAFLRFIRQEEMDLKTQREGIAEAKRTCERDLAYLQRQSKQISADLIRDLGVEREQMIGDDLGLALLRNAAESNLQECEKETPSEDNAAMVSLREERDRVLAEQAVIKDEVKRHSAERNLRDQQVRQLRGERSTVDAKEIKALLGQVCPVCIVPIDQVLGEGCGLSHELWDPTKPREESLRIGKQITACNDTINRLNGVISERERRLNRLRQEESGLATQIAAVEEKSKKAGKERRLEWSTAQRLVSKVSEYQGIMDRIEALNTELKRLAKSDEQASNSEAKYRNQHSDTLSRMKDLFSYVCRRLLGNQTKASLTLSGQGLQADVEVGGMAMESLKAIAFDLATLLMNIEGRTMLPAFLVHDSPREADLGEAIYHRLFKLVRSFEGLGDDPPFQYIITTTSQPPEEFSRLPFLIAELQGSNANQRLLRQNLGGLES
jgi:uncharacterized coiled-coil protein SlyX